MFAKETKTQDEGTDSIGAAGELLILDEEVKNSVLKLDGTEFIECVTI